MKHLILLALLITINAKAQIDLSKAEIPNKLTPKEFNIPASPLFDMMGVAPSMVARTSDIKDFKVDWNFKSWKLSPNLAIETQPIWEIFYNRKKITKYQNAPNLMRKLAGLNLSVGTVQNELNDRRIGGTLKLNLFKQKDPLMEKGVYDTIQKGFDNELIALKENEKRILHILDSVTKLSDIQSYKSQLLQNDQLISSFYSRRNSAIQQAAQQYVAQNWNASFVDIAFGKVYTYKTDSAGSLKKLRLDRNTSSALWINAGMGIGKRILVSGLFRTSFYQEALNFQTLDTITGEILPQEAIANNNLLSYGINIRYGGPIFNFFIEYIKEGKTTKTPIEALNSVFTADKTQQIVSGSVKWDIVDPITFNIGGDWRISRNVILNYGVRVTYDKNKKAKQITPIVNIACMMR